MIELTLTSSILCSVAGRFGMTMQIFFSLASMDLHNTKTTSTTDQALILQARKTNYAEWGAPLLAEPQYINREELIAKSNFSETSQETWVLTSPANSSDILSALETYKSKAIASINGKIIKGDVYALGSVFTHSRHRKNGYASKLLNDVKIALKKRKGSIASTLYSDIGPKYYNKLGWKCKQSKSLLYNIETEFSDIETCEIKSIKELNETTPGQL